MLRRVTRILWTSPFAAHRGKYVWQSGALHRARRVKSRQPHRASCPAAPGSCQRWGWHEVCSSARGVCSEGRVTCPALCPRAFFQTHRKQPPDNPNGCARARSEMAPSARPSTSTSKCRGRRPDCTRYTDRCKRSACRWARFGRESLVTGSRFRFRSPKATGRRFVRKGLPKLRGPSCVSRAVQLPRSREPLRATWRSTSPRPKVACTAS